MAKGSVLWSETQDKLAEARYFLDQMRRYKNDADSFRFVLSAFLSAARSVTLFMQKEYGSRPGFDDWYQQKQAELANDPDMKLFNEKRVITVHKGSLRLRGDHKVEMTASIHPVGSLEIKVVRADGSVEHVSPVPHRRLRRLRIPRPRSFVRVSDRHFEEAPDRDVIVMSGAYFGRLQALVEECAQGVGFPQTGSRSLSS